jgi:nucleoid-associated protein YejK
MFIKEKKVFHKSDLCTHELYINEEEKNIYISLIKKKKGRKIGEMVEDYIEL